jgi:TolB protein
VAGVGAALGPVWHPNGTTVAFTEMLDDGTRVVVRDLVRGTARRFAQDPGSNSSPAFSPDGRTLVFSSGSDGTDLFSAPLDGSAGTYRVTVGRGTTNSQPTFAPDGRRLAFTTSRLGRPEIYITDSDGANPELLTTSGFGDQLYRADPAWSPDGRFVAFSTQIEGRFQIATIGLRDRTVKQHTIEGVNEDPSWAPDARHLVFTSSRTGSKQLWVLDTESGRLRQLTQGSASRMAAWSPRLSNAR